LRKRHRLRAEDWVPALATGIYLYCVFVLPRNEITTSPEELQHRPFVWVYFLVAAWFCGRLYTAVDGTRLGHYCLRPALAVPACLALLAVPFTLGAGVAEHMEWSRFYTRIKVPRGLVDCAAFLRTQTSRLDVIQYSSPDENYVVYGLTERRAYLCYSPRTQAVRERDAPLVVKRVQDLRALEKAATTTALREQAAALGLRWFLLNPADVVNWPQEFLDRPAHSAGGFRVYDLQEAPPNRQAEAGRQG
jgi:hypothetical protein